MKALTWCAGKFVYPKGSSVPAHFMPLQEFSLEPALNYSLLIALRMARVERTDALLSKLEVAQWRNRLLTCEIAQMINALNSVDPDFLDIGGSSGLVFEELKLAWPSGGEQPSYAIVIDAEEPRSALQLLHQNDEWPCRVVASPGLGDLLSERSVVIVNSLLGMRTSFDLLPSPGEIKIESAQACVLALRTCGDDDACMRTTVYGRDVNVPAVNQIKAWMRSTRMDWRYRWLPAHDTGFFLPEEGLADPGVFLAYGGVDPRPMTGFNMLDK